MENLPAITAERARGEIGIALTKEQLGFMQIIVMGGALVFNEDQESIDAIDEFLKIVKKFEDIIDKTHKEGKAPFKAGADSWDEAKRIAKASLSQVVDPIKSKNAEFRTEIVQKQREKAEKEAREAAVRLGVESAIIEYSKQIASAQTVQELTRIELSISNQKSPSAKAKYGDLHQEAINAYNERIIPLLKEKKEGLISLGELETEFGDTGDYERMEEFQSGIEQTRNAITDAEVKVQEAALGMSFTVKPTHEVIIPSVKPRRTYIHWELVDPETALKKAKDLLTVSTNDEACKTVGNSLLGGKENEKKTEVIHNGIRFYKKFLY